MADEIDQANELADLALSVALRNLASQKKIAPKGICYFCEAPVGPAQLYCDSDCAKDHEREERLKNRR